MQNYGRAYQQCRKWRASLMTDANFGDLRSKSFPFKTMNTLFLVKYLCWFNFRRVQNLPDIAKN